MSLFRIINEFKITSEVKTGDNIVVIDGFVYNFGSDDDEEFPDPHRILSHMYRNKIISDTPDEFLSYYEDGITFETIQEMISEELFDNHKVIIGYVADDNYFEVMNLSSMHIAPDSSQLSKIVKRLRLDGVRYYDEQFVGADETTHEITVEIDREEFLKPLQNKVFFHGTNMRNAINILRYGLRPSTKSNWGKINHEDKVFLTTLKNYASFHANHASGEILDAVILEINIPDVNKLVIDYDIANKFLGADHEETKRLGYDRFERPNFFDEKFRDENKDIIKRIRNVTKLSSTYGIYGYMGAIHPSHIVALHTSENYVMNFIGYAYYGSEINANSESLNEFQRYTKHEFMALINRIKEEFDEEFYLDDE